MAVALKNGGDYADAESSARQAVALDPGYGDAHELLGDILIKEQHPQDAATEYVAAANITPGKAELWGGAASAYGAAGQFDSAAEYADKAVAVDPTYEQGWVFKGNAAYARHDLAGAKAAWAEALVLKPKDATLVRYMAVLNGAK